MNGSAALRIDGYRRRRQTIRSLPPTGLINDFITGHMGALGAAARADQATNRRRQLARHRQPSPRNAMWYQTLGLVDPRRRRLRRRGTPSVCPTPYGRRHLRWVGLHMLAPPVSLQPHAQARWPDPILVPRGVQACPNGSRHSSLRRCDIGGTIAVVGRWSRRVGYRVGLDALHLNPLASFRRARHGAGGSRRSPPARRWRRLVSTGRAWVSSAPGPTAADAGPPCSKQSANPAPRRRWLGEFARDTTGFFRRETSRPAQDNPLRLCRCLPIRPLLAALVVDTLPTIAGAESGPVGAG